MSDGIKLELPKGMLEEQVGKGIRATIMAGAVHHIVNELTPERLKEFAIGILDQGLEALNGYELRNMVVKTAEPMMRAYCIRPDFISRVEVAVREGMEKLVTDLPDIVYKEFKDIIVNAIVEKSKRNNGRY